MFGALLLYSGLVLSVAGLVLSIEPAWIGTTRTATIAIFGAGVAVAVIALLLPAGESRVARATTRLDRVLPRWQFAEHHELAVDAPAARVYDAMKAIKADEIFLFRTLSWIRRGGRKQPESILNVGTRDPVIEVAVRNGFVSLGDDPPRELVVGTVVVAPPGHTPPLTARSFDAPFPPGYAVAAMNFVVTSEGPSRTLVTTETRVFATSDEARRRFAVYWRAIYPGSAIIRRMWLRAIKRRAESR